MTVGTTGTLNRRRAMIVAEACIAGGVRHAVLSPGARNTPLVLALNELERAGRPITLHSVLDERAAAFYGLGLARMTGRPTLLSCTSGTAGAHYLPAIIEAAHSGVPLLAMTADRPEELQSRSAPQTIDQRDMYGHHVRKSFDLGTPSADTDDTWVAGIMAQAIDAATDGPVHVNMPFREPLWDPQARDLPRPAAAVIHRGTTTTTPAMVDAFVSGLSERGVVVCGPDTAVPTDATAILALADRLGWPVLADPLSALRFGHRGPVVHHHDAFLRSEPVRAALRPDTVIHVGGTPSSKPLMGLLREAPSVIAVDPSGQWRDPWHSLRAVIATTVSALVTALTDRTLPSASPAWASEWMAMDERTGACIAAACADDWWEGSIAHTVIRNLPAGALLHVASSMPIRDVDGFAPRRSRPLRVVANRGVNGIDGIIATTLGEAYAWADGPTALLVGDLSFLHDIGSLTNTPAPRRPVVMVVVDNGGGGIFGHLPIAQHTECFEPWFVTPHRADIPALCAGFGLDCTAVRDLAGLRAALETGLATEGVHVVHASVDRAFSTARHAEAWAHIRSTLEAER